MDIGREHRPLPYEIPDNGGAEDDINATGANFEPEQYASTLHGLQYYSGSDVRVYFDDILVRTESIGYQITQNVRPIYPYHSHVYSQLQYGTRLVQGYILIPLTKSGYLRSVLTTVEKMRRTGKYSPLFYSSTQQKKSTGEGYKSVFQLGTTVDTAVKLFGGNWRAMADYYDTRRGSESTGALSVDETAHKVDVHGLMPPIPMANDFVYNPAWSVIRDVGFTLSIVFGVPDTSAVKQTPTKVGSVSGTMTQLFECHIIAGPNVQVENDGRPIGEVYTFIARDLT